MSEHCLFEDMELLEALEFLTAFSMLTALDVISAPNTTLLSLLTHWGKLKAQKHARVRIACAFLCPSKSQ